jgi:thioredoxin 1
VVDALAAAPGELGEPVLLDLALRVEPERLLDLDLDPEALAVEPVLVALLEAAKRLVALEQVLQRPPPGVVDRFGNPRGKGTVGAGVYLSRRPRNAKGSRMSTDVTTSTFEQEVIQSEKPVIVDFWAEWCGPCHAVAPVLERIAEERKDEVKLVKVNIDDEQQLAMRYGIASIPTIVLFKDGQPAAAAIGAQPKSALERALGLAA